jgi:ABC-type glycerol-3-phosphate transport system substrate-binding protein
LTASGKETARREDIVFVEGGEFHRFLSDLSLLSLSPYINAEAEAESLALPLVCFMDLFFYHFDILKAADCDRPPKTRADFLATARAVANLKNVFPLAVGFGGLAGEGTPKQVLRRDLYPWIWADNSPSRERPLFRERAPSREDEPPKEGEPSKESDLSIKGIDVILVSASDQSPALSRASINAVAFLELLNREGLLAPGAFEKTGEQRLKEFAEGKIAMMAGSVRDIPFLRKNVNGFDFGITAVPTTATGKNRLGLSGIYAGISGACTQPDEAWAFLEFIAGKNETLAQALDAVPGCFPSSFPADYIANDPLYSKAWDIFEAAETVDQYSPSSLDDIFLYDEADRLIREKLAEIPFR